jgi:methylenetetrahydrofolate dehydrogenase (NADP+)/methenyltetrahydrofolate cyclohydrolase
VSLEPRARIIDGKAQAQDLRDAIAADTAAMKLAHGVVPCLAVILVGDDPASQVYVRNKGEQAQSAGMRSRTIRLPANVAEGSLLALVEELNQDWDVDGILVQLPLPSPLDASRVIAAIDPDKDVDGLTLVNAGRLASNAPGLAPCTPLGCMILIRSVLEDLSGLRAVVVGRSNLMGKPMAQLLLQADCTVTLAHSRTRDLAAVCRDADILVVAVGRPEMVKGDFIRPGAVVIDVGINRTPSRDPVKAAAGGTRLVGDVDFAEALQIAGAVTPVPGGVGPMTIACLLRNTLKAACLRRGLQP